MTSRFEGLYAKEFLVGWGSMDLNGHLANTGYLNLAADARMSFFGEHGFPPDEFTRLGIGPVIRKEELEYFHEITLHEIVTVTHAALGMSPDGTRYIVENEIWSAKGERAGSVRSTGGWLELRGRKLVAPPPALLQALKQTPRAPGYVDLSPPR